jgi:iron(III) transport system permease protein
MALLPIITPPFVVGLGLILLFGRAGVVNQFLEYAFGIPPTRWFYGCLASGSRRCLPSRRSPS